MTLVIVTVVLNDPGGLRATLKSIDQSRSIGVDASLLVMDGGSSTETLSVANAFLKRPGDRLHSATDLGPYDAMNRSLDIVTDEDLVWFVNAGDCLLDKSVLPSVLEWTAGADFVWGYGPVVIIENDGTVRRVPRQLPYTLPRHAVGKTPICHQTVVARASAMRAAGGFDLRFPIAADFKLLLRLGKSATPRTWPRPIVAYRAGGLSDRNVFEARRQQILIRRQELPLERKALREAVLADRARLSKLIIGQGLDWFAAKRLIPRDWRRRASSLAESLAPRGRTR